MIHSPHASTYPPKGDACVSPVSATENAYLKGTQKREVGLTPQDNSTPDGLFWVGGWGKGECLFPQVHSTAKSRGTASVCRQIVRVHSKKPAQPRALLICTNTVPFGRQSDRQRQCSSMMAVPAQALLIFLQCADTQEEYKATQAPGHRKHPLSKREANKGMFTVASQELKAADKAVR